MDCGMKSRTYIKELPKESLITIKLYDHFGMVSLYNLQIDKNKNNKIDNKK